MLKTCPNCGFQDDPMWKPLAWRLYWEYAPESDFVVAYPNSVRLLNESRNKKPNKCLTGNFNYHFEDEFYYYQLTTERAKRKLVRRFPKGYEAMANRSLFEVTPSERNFLKGTRIV
jgi:hypothetical protein